MYCVLYIVQVVFIDPVPDPNISTFRPLDQRIDSNIRYNGNSGITGDKLDKYNHWIQGITRDKLDTLNTRDTQHDMMSPSGVSFLEHQQQTKTVYCR